MDAKKAKEIADLNNEKALSIDKVLGKIQEASESGEYGIYIYEILPDSVISKLQKLGYEVRTINGQDEPGMPVIRYSVDWK